MRELEKAVEESRRVNSLLYNNMMEKKTSHPGPASCTERVKYEIIKRCLETVEVEIHFGIIITVIRCHNNNNNACTCRAYKSVRINIAVEVQRYNNAGCKWGGRATPY